MNRPRPAQPWLVRGVRDTLADAGADGVWARGAGGGTDGGLGGARVAAAVAAHQVLGSRGTLGAAHAVAAQISGAGPLQPLLRRPGVTDVLVNGPGEVWVDDGAGLRRVDVDLGTEDDLRALAVRLAAVAGRRLDDASPCVDAQLGDGVRLHAVLPPLSPVGTLLSLRVPHRRGFDLDELVARGSVPAAWAPVLRAVVRERLSFLVTGGTGSGKTTVLSTLLGLADPGERLLLVEDGGELTPRHPHVVRLQTRPGNVEGAGRVDLAHLVRQGLRMRPDRVVGKVIRPLPLSRSVTPNPTQRSAH